VTDVGHRHPVLLGVGDDPGDGPAVPGTWESLPPLGGAARLGQPKPLATTLAADEADRPLLVALDVARGRTLAAAWDSSWPWALSSDAGLAVHRTLWRQMVTWLANRRPVLWIITDRSRYVHGALAGGQQSVRITAGVSGLAGDANDDRQAQFSARLELRRLQNDRPPQTGPPSRPAASARAVLLESGPTQQTWRVPLEYRGHKWRAELPQDLHTQAWLAPGAYELSLKVERPETAPSPDGASSPWDGLDERLQLTARTGFEITAVELELKEPSANLALLRDAAARTSAVGSHYYGIDELPEVLRQLAQTDLRRRIERPAEFDLVARQPWLPLAAITVALAVEWVLRKRSGMA
jgi:hypothetical protein